MLSFINMEKSLITGAIAVNVLLASPAASLTSTTPIQTASFLSTSILPAASSPNTPIQTQSTVSDSTS